MRSSSVLRCDYSLYFLQWYTQTFESSLSQSLCCVEFRGQLRCCLHLRFRGNPNSVMEKKLEEPPLGNQIRSKQFHYFIVCVCVLLVDRPYSK